nr:putative reverse transcriptase domain, ribonuclease H-like domain protein [Tanacetum cinerariifolium]
MSNSKCPELARRFDDQVPQTVTEMMKRVNDFVKSEEAFKSTELPKGEQLDKGYATPYKGSDLHMQYRVEVHPGPRGTMAIIEEITTYHMYPQDRWAEGCKTTRGKPRETRWKRHHSWKDNQHGTRSGQEPKTQMPRRMSGRLDERANNFPIDPIRLCIRRTVNSRSRDRWVFDTKGVRRSRSSGASHVRALFLKLVPSHPGPPKPNSHEIVVEASSPYNIILGRIGMRELRAISSTTHAMMKFPTNRGIATLPACPECKSKRYPGSTKVEDVGPGKKPSSDEGSGRMAQSGDSKAGMVPHMDIKPDPSKKGEERYDNGRDGDVRLPKEDQHEVEPEKVLVWGQGRKVPRIYGHIRRNTSQPQEDKGGGRPQGKTNIIRYVSRTLHEAEKLHLVRKVSTMSVTPISKIVAVEKWTLFTDGASSLKGAGAGLVLIDPTETEYTYAIRLNFTSTNNEAEYEALLARLRIARKMKVPTLKVKVDFKLVAFQMNGEFVASSD